MSPQSKTRSWIGSTLLLGTLITIGAALTAWKSAAAREAAAAAASQPEPMETVHAVEATERAHRRTVTAVGTVLALRSITLRNELAGTVRHVALTPGQIVDSGTVLVALDVAVEEAELSAQQAQADLARSSLERLQRLRQSDAVSAEEFDRARAEHTVAVSQVARTRAVIARKTIRAPFRARVGIADVHPGQYLNEGTQLTTLQGVADAAHVDFAVAQDVAAGLRQGDRVAVVAISDAAPIEARIVAVDARVDPATRSTTVRARIAGAGGPRPGASVRVRVPVGAGGTAVAVPVSALRKGPGGDHVFVLAADSSDRTRAHLRQVRAGDAVGDEVVILEGLAAGERVAASGSFKLREGVLVVVANPPAASGNGGR